MPFLRFSRDKRGYEHTYLCHTFRRGGQPQRRVLYWFRTPPDVKVGRLALDPEAIRAIEESNPDLKFEWDKILKVKLPPPPPEYGRDRREARRGRRRGRDSDAGGDAAAAGSTAATVPVEAIESAAPVESDAERVGPEPASADPDPAAVGWDEPDAGDESAGPVQSGRAHVVLGLTDEQGLARLRARHAEIQARISERSRDVTRLEELRAQAALLDPDAWRTVEEARDRLASLDEATAAIRKVLGRRRRARRGGARRRQQREGERGEASEVGAAPVALPHAGIDPPDE